MQSLGQHDIDFVAEKSFKGKMPNFVFKTGPRGLGYYKDANVSHVSSGSSDIFDESKCLKRKFEANIESEKSKKRQTENPDDDLPLHQNKSDDNNDLLADLDKLKELILGLEKKINSNQAARIRFSDEPSKFANSEVDLYDSIQALHTMAATPEAFEVMVELGTVQSLIGLLTHENIDISSSVVSLLEEITQPNESNDENECTTRICSFIISHQVNYCQIQLASINNIVTGT